MGNRKKNNHRNFLRLLLTTGTAITTVTPIRKNSTSQSNNKIKMFTADGKLVEADKSVIERNRVSKRASNNEVLEWMSVKNKT